MGSPGSGSVGCSVGSIVWVRRRNGSWWPGKILGPEELSVSHLMSPRSGTPVKLLGREDASVDWYNLEKSKRVKAFRCGEFDDCIERVESSPGLLIKKREKYARREDAILHALELEKQLLNKHGNLSTTSDHNCRKSPSGVKKEPITSSGSHGNDKEKYGNSKSHHQFSNKLDTAHQDEIIGSPLCLEKLKKENHLNSEDDNSEATPRMRGLQDFGLRIAPSKRKLLSSAPNGSERPSIDSTSQALPAHGLSMGSASLGNGDHSLNRRKRSNEGLAEAILVKRRDRRRPLVQVMQNSANLGISHPLQPDYGTVSTSISGVEQMGAISREKRSKCVYLPTEPSESWEYKVPVSHNDISPPQFGEGSCLPHLGSFLEENASGFMKDVDSGSFLEENASGFMEDVYSDSSDTNSDSCDDSETEPEMDKKMAVLSVTEADPYVLGCPEAQRNRGILSSGEQNEPANSGNIFIHSPPQPVPANEAVVKWSTKRKRNARNLSRGYADALNRKNLDFGLRTFRHNLGFLGSDDFDDGVSDVAYPMPSIYSNKRHDMSHWEGSGWEDEGVLGRYWEDKQEYFDPKFPDHHHLVGGGRARSILVDVDLKVQASYQKEPVPIVSLMSKLNGKAIIGHPIQIGILEDGSTDTLLSTVNDVSNETMDDPPTWRTARRTANSRIPRPHFPYTPDNDEATQDHLFLDRDRKPPSKKGSSSHKASASRKKFLKKPPKSSPLSSQKTRTLSSIAVEQKYSSKPILDSSNCLMDGPLIKQESTGTTTVACIPVKLVFSRLLEKIKHGSV